MKLAPYGWKTSQEKNINPPETEFPFNRNLSKGVLAGGLLTLLVEADAWLLTCWYQLVAFPFVSGLCYFGGVGFVALPGL